MSKLRATILERSALVELKEALAAASLPFDDLEEPGRLFFRFEDEELVGYGGLEGSGPDRLLRSLIVVSGRRGAGLGVQILEEMERRATAIGAARLHLLTTTAEVFFRRKGYEFADRASAPNSIAGSAEFTSLCPASAAYLVKVLGG